MIKNINIDVTKIDKSKLRDGKYLQLVWFDFKDGDRVKTNKDSQPIVSSTGKTLKVSGLVKQDGEEGEELPILGESTYWEDTGLTSQESEEIKKKRESAQKAQENYDEIDPENIPF